MPGDDISQSALTQRPFLPASIEWQHPLTLIPSSSSRFAKGARQEPFPLKIPGIPPQKGDEMQDSKPAWYKPPP